MTVTGNPEKILILGASGKVARRLRVVWKATPPTFEPIWWEREDVARFTHENAAPPLRAAGIIALWGVSYGNEQELAQNVSLGRLAQKIAAKISAERVLHASTQAVYGRDCNNAAETQALSPASPYGQAKIVMEEEVKIIGPACPIILRLSNVFGADSLAHYMQQDARLQLDRFADGLGPLRSYIGATDLAHLLEALVQRPIAQVPKVLNVAAPRPLSMQRILEVAKVPFDWRPAPKSALQHATLDTSLLAQAGLPVPQAQTAEALMQDWRETGGL